MEPAQRIGLDSFGRGGQNNNLTSLRCLPSLPSDLSLWFGSARRTANDTPVGCGFFLFGKRQRRRQAENRTRRNGIGNDADFGMVPKGPIRGATVGHVTRLTP